MPGAARQRMGAAWPQLRLPGHAQAAHPGRLPKLRPRRWLVYAGLVKRVAPALHRPASVPGMNSKAADRWGVGVRGAGGRPRQLGWVRAAQGWCGRCAGAAGWGENGSRGETVWKPQHAHRPPASKWRPIPRNPGASGGSKALAGSPSATPAPGTPRSGAPMVELEGKSLYEALGVARDASQVLISAAQPLISLSQQPRSPRLLNPQPRPTSARPTSSWPWPCTPTRTPTTPRPRSGSRRCRRSTASCPTQTSAGRRAGGQPALGRRWICGAWHGRRGSRLLCAGSTPPTPPPL